MKHLCLALRLRFAVLLALRWRLTLWTAGLVLVLGFGLVLFINSITAIRLPRVLREELMPVIQPRSEPSVLVPTIQPRAEPSARLPTPRINTAPPLAAEPVSQLSDAAIVVREVTTISLIGLGLFALVGSIGTFWLVKHALRPVRNLSHLAQKIQVETLHQRLPMAGPPDEMRELALSFNRMLERLEQAFEQQDRFVADAAHELRTPLATLRTSLEVIQQNPKATLADYQTTLSVLGRALSRLEVLVEDLLLLAKGERELRIERTEMEVLLHEIIEEMKPFAQAHQVEIQLKVVEQITIPVDTVLFYQAVSNLLENGIRYNRPGGSVTVHVSRARNGVELRVEDTGIGIPIEAQPHLFERFFRFEDSRARSQGGAGLGLAITAHIVQLHGGHVRFQSSPGVGSIFTLWIPDTGQMSEEAYT